MRYLATHDIPALFDRDASIEQFLGRSPVDADHVRYVELRPTRGGVEIWVHDVEDIGGEDLLDLYAFPYFESDGPEGPVAVQPDPQAAMAHASATLAANPSRWVGPGVAQSEYLDYIRAGRPLTWPASPDDG
jgi:hypothetical protein